MIANAADAALVTTTALAMTGAQKAAVLLVMLGDKSSAELIKQLPEDDIQLVSREIARISTISTDQAESVLEEFYQMTTAHDFVVRGGLDYAKSMLINAFGPEAAQKIMDRLSKTLGHDMANFDALQKADPQQLAKFLHAEHPQTIALVLSHLNPTQAAALLAALPPEQRADISLRVAHLDQISPDVINKIATVIGQKLNALGDYSRQSYGGVRSVAEMFNRLDSDTSKKVLADIEAQDPALVETIRHMMFVFDDLLLLDENAIKAILGRVDRKVPMVALKGTTDRMKTHFLSTMSERGAQMMREDIEALGPIKVKDVEVAQQEIISVLRLLEAEGVVSLRGAVGEQYVV
jgi:flagellar motor switch protein FliG